jgi:hypothetical protein
MVWANPKESKSKFRNNSKTKINPNNPNNPNFYFRIYKRGTNVPLFYCLKAKNFLK